MRKFLMMLVGGIVVGSAGIAAAAPSLNQLPPEKKAAIVALRNEYVAKRNKTIQDARAKAGSMSAAQVKEERRRVAAELIALKRDYAQRAASTLGINKVKSLSVADKAKLREQIVQIKSKRDAQLQALKSEMTQAFSKASATSDKKEMVQSFRQRASAIKKDARVAAFSAIQNYK